MRTIVKIIITALLPVFMLASCEDPYKNEPFVAFDDVTIAVWLGQQPEYSKWVQLLKATDVYNSLNLSTVKYTCFIADNDAVEQYVTENTELASTQELLSYIADTAGQGKQDNRDMLANMKLFMKYHILPNAQLSHSKMLLKIPSPTASGDYLTAYMDYATSERYISNGDGREPSYLITEYRDQKAINGYIHRLNRALVPMMESLWDVLSAPGSRYKIFSEAIEASGLAKWVDSVYVRDDVNRRDYKTIFAVSDSVYMAYGIPDLDELKNRHDDGREPNNPDSDFYQYVFYHIMDRFWGYADLTQFPLAAASSERLKTMIIHTGFGYNKFHQRWNYKGLAVKDEGTHIVFNPETEQKCQIIPSRRDIPARNGYIHEVDGLMNPPSTLSHYTMVYEPTDMKPFREIPGYRSEKLDGSVAVKYDMTDSMSKGAVDGFRWWSTIGVPEFYYLNQYINMTSNTFEYYNHDLLVWRMDNGYIEMDIPELPAGKYVVYCYKLNDASAGGHCKVEFNNVLENADRNFTGNNNFTENKWPGPTNSTLFGFTQPTTMVARFTVGSSGGNYKLDRLVFYPL